MSNSLFKAAYPYLLIYLTLFGGCESSSSRQQPDQPEPDTTAAVTESDGTSGFQTLPGFEVQKIYEVSRENQGTWIALTVGPDGDLYASDQSRKGIYRISVSGSDEDPDVSVEELSIQVSGAHGLTWAFDHLYANVNGRGIFRLRDSRGDDRFDVMEFLGGPSELGEHGNHTLLPTPDGEGLYVINGNYTPPPQLDGNRLSNWDEDILLPRQWDARGNARGIYAPGGYIARIPPEATAWEMISIGYRNIYDAAVNRHGELFTFDSDMEFDMGMPWYRPTRLIHVVSGSDYGWRSGSGKWKSYYEDTLPPLLEVGPGSPTGMLFGTGARFPARYQRALYALDWIYGAIYAFHLTPEGSTYSAEAEEFLSGDSLPLTDAVIGNDGAMYFITGGRSNESQLYRVVYQGDESTEPARPVDNPEAQAARELRHRLESFHGRQDPAAVEAAWPYLESEDRFIRHAARVAVEAQPVGSWAPRALSEKHPQARITALVALARTGSPEYRDKALESLLELPAAKLRTKQKLGYLRAMSLVFMRLGDPGDRQRRRIIETLHELLPGVDDRVNIELVRLLVYLQDSGVIEKALTLMQNAEPPAPPEWSNLMSRSERFGGTVEQLIENPPPVTGLEYAFMLRNLREGWTIEQRRTYFTYINEAAGKMGGTSYAGFLQRMRNEALNNASPEEHRAVADITGVELVQEPPFEIRDPEGPGRDWTLNEAIVAVAEDLENRNFENGRNAYFATGCAACHRFNGYGGNIGPDLGTIGMRASITGILQDIIRPDSIVSDQYSSSEVRMKDGTTYIGLVVDERDSLKIYPRDPDSPPAIVTANRVQSVTEIDLSPMPAGLVDPLNPEELRDLIAYLRSGGDPDSKLFRGNR